MESTKKNLLGSRKSLNGIDAWNFMPNRNGKIIPIPLTMPKRLSVEEFERIVSRYSTCVITDGDVCPGTTSLLVFSESLARELINAGSRLIKKKAFIDANALS